MPNWPRQSLKRPCRLCVCQAPVTVLPLIALLGQDVCEASGAETGICTESSMALGQVVPILRAGLVLLEQASTVLPNSQTLHVGYVRNEETLEVSLSGALPATAVTAALLSSKQPGRPLP